MLMIKKIVKGPAAALFPVPVVMVTSQSADSTPNIITVAWTGVMNSEPPVVYIGVRSEGRYSYQLIKESGEFVINIPSVSQARATDLCGVVSGKDVNKFEETGLTPMPATQVKAPLIAECPVNVECRVRQVLELGSHNVFIADVVAVQYSEDVLDEKGRPDIDKIQPYAYCMREYRLIADKLGSYGYSKRG